ncbi:putative ATPase/DNA-binding winged helix-turn-helix (wHTH) protein [Bradyrhizobium centrosematis]|nr:putative ATPase/DNA-binding winged helix-turn-helix (wHTH) protein [Bradyrhizobium centrosematis]MCS3775781.1 putative ATPase/DNA-binding winged helix-turn-helix (wHTH) protein [Bradyrhizobium centrosematis]
MQVNARATGSDDTSGQFPEHDTVSFGPFSLRTRVLEKGGAPVRLGSRATDILRILVDRAGEVVSKHEILAFAWPGLAVEEISLRVHVAELRKVLGDGKDGARYITNVPSRGYCFVAPVQRISSQAPTPSRSAASDNLNISSLPHRLERMIGREDTLKELSARLTEDRFVTLRGPGGIGKTTVAVAVAHEVRPTFEGQVLFLDLAPLREPPLVATTLASALGLVVHHTDPTESIVTHLREKRCLLVFDGCEHLIDVVARLAETIVEQAPQVSILATSRESLLVEGEHIFELVPLESPPEDERLTANEVLGYPAARLFTERAAAAGHPIRIHDDDAEILTEICRKLDGIALAIELAAVRTGAHSLQEIASLLDGRLKLEWRGRRTAPPRHQTLGATLDWSYSLIGERERFVLRHLSVFAGPFTLQGAVAVAGEEGEDTESVVEMLEQLVAKSLVSARPGPSSTRYRLLDTTRAYALQKLSEMGETTGASYRHAQYVRHALEATTTELNPANPGSWSQERAALLADARPALAWVYGEEGAAELRVPLAACCARLFVELNLLSEGRLWSTRALEALDSATEGTVWELDLQSTLGHAFMFTQRNGEQAEAALRRGLEIAEALGDKFSKYRLLARSNMFYRRTGEYQRLVPLAREADRIAQEIGDRAGIAGAKALLGVSWHLFGDQHAAQLHLDEGMQGQTALRDAQPTHFAYSRTPQIPLARVLWLRGYPDRAVECVRPLTEAAAPRDAVMYCIALCWSASVYGWVGDWGSVASLGARLAAHAQMHGLVTYQAVAEGFRGQVMIEREQIEEGVSVLRASLERLHADRYELYASAFVADLLKGLAVLGQHSSATAVLGQAIDRFGPRGEAFDAPELLRLRGELEALSGDRHAAEASFRASADLAEEQGALSWRLRTEMSRARLRLQQGVSEPMAGLAEIYKRFTEGFDTRDLLSARTLLESSSSA